MLVWALTLAAAAQASQTAVTLDQTMTEADRRHLLARTGFGVSPDDFMTLDGMTRREGIAWVVDGLQTTPTRPMPTWTTRSLPHYHARQSLDQAGRVAFDRRRDDELASLRTWWVGEMLEGASPATERLVLLWHDLVPSGYHAINRGSLPLADQNALFRRMHQGRWADLLKALVRDSALLLYLDNDRNRVEAPNENLARELLELFTLGEGNYDEHTVREAARALTGFASQEIAYPTFRLHSWKQDRAEKVLFGQRGPHDADDLVDIILQQPQAARFLARRYWHTFVSDHAPDSEWLDAVAAMFRDADHDLSVLYREVLYSEAFWAPEYRATLIKSPVDLITGLARTLEYPKRAYEGFAALQGALGLGFFDPPNVAGWDEGEAWISSARLLARFDAVRAVAGLVQDDQAASAVPSMSPGEDTMSMESDTGETTLLLRVAGEDYQGAAELTAAIVHDERITWKSDVLVISGGYDTERLGKISSRADLPWQSIRLQVPSELAEKTDAIRIEFLNDAAGGSGDRNVYVGAIQLGEHVMDASSGVQTSECVPPGAGRAGDLYCAGHVLVDLPEPPPTINVPEVRAAAVRVRSATVNPDKGNVRVTLMLEHVQLGELSAELLQVRIVDKARFGPEMRIDSFECRPECVRHWPECAWRDPHFAPLVATAVPLAQNARKHVTCLEQSFEPGTRDWLHALADEVPSLLERAAESVEGSQREALDTLISRVAEVIDPAFESKMIIDPGFAPPKPTLEPPQSVSVRVATLDALVETLAPSGVDPVKLLWPGLEPPATQGKLNPNEHLATVLTHPAFQVR